MLHAIPKLSCFFVSWGVHYIPMRASETRWEKLYFWKYFHACFQCNYEPTTKKSIYCRLHFTWFLYRVNLNKKTHDFVMSAALIGREKIKQPCFIKFFLGKLFRNELTIIFVIFCLSISDKSIDVS
jgi:hypothetical protein